MPTNVCVINGHPDPSPKRLIHALADAYQSAASGAGHDTSRIDVAALEYGFLTSAARMSEPPPEAILQARDQIAEADHVCLLFPLWLGSMPSKCRAFFEWAACGGFFIEESETKGGWPKQLMKGKSARIIVTMGMPGAIYSLFWGAHALKAFEQGVLGISGFKPIRHSVLGGVGEASPKQVTRWLAEISRLGARAQ
jgi:putative NADPH-quinone reductase